MRFEDQCWVTEQQTWQFSKTIEIWYDIQTFTAGIQWWLHPEWAGSLFIFPNSGGLSWLWPPLLLKRLYHSCQSRSQRPRSFCPFSWDSGNEIAYFFADHTRAVTCVRWEKPSSAFGAYSVTDRRNEYCYFLWVILLHQMLTLLISRPTVKYGEWTVQFNQWRTLKDQFTN